jgi:membrane-associated phospholipid phosphatase
VGRAQAIKTVAWGMVLAGATAPLLRKRLPVRPVVAQTVAFGAPLGAAVAMRRSHRRDVAVCALQMWAYLAAYKTPHDDPSSQQARVLVDYPIVIDRALGLGELPTVRLQRAFAKEQWRAGDRLLVWAHWLWFAVPHGSLLYILLRHPRRFDRAAVMTYAVFDLGAIFYWIVPTAPPWYAASIAERSGELDHHRQIVVRRMMVEYGEFFWKDGWGPLYSVLGGNPLAAMPSLHFATSMMAALLLAETGPLAGAFGWAYTATLGVALVYLGEHYAVDLLAGAALTKAIRRLGPRAGPAVACLGRSVASIEALAHGAA